jgi:hypothetical protein
VEAGKKLAREFGIADLPIVIVPHPIYTKSATEMKNLADASFTRIIEAVTIESGRLRATAS